MNAFDEKGQRQRTQGEWPVPAISFSMATNGMDLKRRTGAFWSDSAIQHALRAKFNQTKSIKR